MSQAQTASDITWMIGGAQGSGVDSSANIFARSCAEAGLWIFGDRQFYSNIKGLHSYFEVRVSNEQKRSKLDHVDLLATFDAESLMRHAEVVKPNGGIIYNPALSSTAIDRVDTLEENIANGLKSRLAQQGLTSDVKGILDEAKHRGVHLYPISFDQIINDTAKVIGETQLSKVTRIVNVLAVSASLAILGLEVDYLNKAIVKTFGNKKKVIDMNVAGARIAYDHTANQFRSENFPFRISATHNQPRRLLWMGFQAVALGKIVGGCRFETYYPITPAADECEFLESNENFELLDGLGVETENRGSVVVVQTEDEIAAVTMAIGAALTGTRASTATSGPGFSLMVEGLGWAGMNEVPVVVTLFSRGGPSTGMPTRSEEADLKFAISAGHGEFPRIVLCSGDLQESFYDAIRAYNYAERFQMPVIHIVDKAMANSNSTAIPPESNLVPIQRGKLLGNGYKPTPEVQYEREGYKRFAFVEDGISPRAVLGQKGYTFWNTGDEHNEFGHIEEDPDNRVKMMTKRMTKLESAAREIPAEEKVNFFPSQKQDADVTIVSWGSTKGAILDAMGPLEKDGIDAEFLQIRLAHPFPANIVKDRLSKARLVIDIEQNYSAQMASVIAEKTHSEIKNKVVKFNGRPISQDEVYNSVRHIVSNPAGTERMVLVHGA
jgi:2-oxoglutarate ferredoxin oxidoreductase subunit alpha